MSPLEAVNVLRARGFAAEVERGEGRIRGGRSADEAGGIRFFADPFAIDRLPAGWSCRFVAGLVASATGATSLDEAVAPGGNAVLSYLDVVAPDGTSTEQIERVLERFQADVTPEARLVESVGIRFHVRPGLGNPAVEFAALSARLLTVLRQPRSA